MFMLCYQTQIARFRTMYVAKRMAEVIVLVEHEAHHL